MSKTIKIQATTYTALDQVRRKGETFSQAVSRLLRIYHYSDKMYRALRGPEPPVKPK